MYQLKIVVFDHTLRSLVEWDDYYPMRPEELGRAIADARTTCEEGQDRVQFLQAIVEPHKICK